MSIKNRSELSDVERVEAKIARQEKARRKLSATFDRFFRKTAGEVSYHRDRPYTVQARKRRQRTWLTLASVGEREIAVRLAESPSDGTTCRVLYKGEVVWPAARS